MYKLIVVAGPNRGSTYSVKDGENSIGRQPDNVVVLTSARVSKRHCVLVVNNESVTLKDNGSANGTFVNGVLTTEKKIRAGDKISVGEFVLELSGSTRRKSSRSRSGQPALELVQPGHPGHVLAINEPAGHALQGLDSGAGLPAGAGQNFDPALNSGMGLPADLGSGSANPAAPTDFKGKALLFVEQNVMPTFYGLNFKYEWRFILAGMIAAFVVLAAFITIIPLLHTSQNLAKKEVGRRAAYIAREIVHRNTAALAAQTETKTEIGAAEGAFGVQLAMLTDLELRIIAPATKLNQYLATGEEAIIAKKARDQFRTGRETGLIFEGKDAIVAVEPVKALNPAIGRNEVIGMAVVSIENNIALAEMGDAGIIFSQTLIVTGILGALIGFLIYRLTLKPLEVLGDDMDKALKGELEQVTHEFRAEETNPLWDLINSALQRIGAANSSSDSMGGGMDAGGGFEETAAVVRSMAALAPIGVVICDADRKITFANEKFEQITGVRVDGAIGQDIPSVAREEAFGHLANDLFDRAVANSSEAPQDDYEFSGTPHKVSAIASVSMGAAKGYILFMVRAEG